MLSWMTLSPDQYLAAGTLLLYIRSRLRSPRKAPEASASPLNTRNSMKNRNFGQGAHFLRVDPVLDSLNAGRVFLLFDLVPASHQITAHKDAVGILHP